MTKGYRFGDLTPEELTLIGLSILDRMKVESECRKSIVAMVRNVAERRYRLLETLYQEVRDAHMQAIKDGKNNEGAYYG
jgi:hypothetical protein